MSQRGASALFVLLLCTVFPGLSQPVPFEDSGYTIHGLWHARGSVTPAHWQPGALVTVDATFQMTDNHLRSLAAAGIRARSVCLLVTAERTFDSDGWRAWRATNACPR